MGDLQVREGAEQEAAPATARRNTVQRALVLEAVRALRFHPTSDEVYNEVRKRHPSISRATVYRNLRLLADNGEVSRVEVTRGADRYDLTTAPHYHARCRVCGRVFDVEMPYRADLPSCVTDAHGFLIEGHQILFEGLCPECQRA